MEGDRDIQMKAALQQAIHGDSQAFAELVQAHQTKVFGITYAACFTAGAAPMGAARVSTAINIASSNILVLI